MLFQPLGNPRKGRGATPPSDSIFQARTNCDALESEILSMGTGNGRDFPKDRRSRELRGTGLGIKSVNSLKELTLHVSASSPLARYNPPVGELTRQARAGSTERKHSERTIHILDFGASPSQLQLCRSADLVLQEPLAKDNTAIPRDAAGGGQCRINSLARMGHYRKSFPRRCSSQESQSKGPFI